jgi:hypothetical protein
MAENAVSISMARSVIAESPYTAEA